MSVTGNGFYPAAANRNPGKNSQTLKKRCVALQTRLV